jgi:hypothetical protein
MGLADHTKNCKWVDVQLLQGLYEAHVTSRSISSSLAKATPIENTDFFEAFPDGTSVLKVTEYHKRRMQMSYLFKWLMTTFPVRNAFWGMCFGDNKNGVYRAAIYGTMHFSKSGFFKYVIKTIYHPMTELEHSAANLLVEKWLLRNALLCCAMPRGLQSSMSFPASTSPVVSRLTLLSCARRFGSSLPQ